MGAVRGRIASGVCASTPCAGTKCEGTSRSDNVSIIRQSLDMSGARHSQDQTPYNVSGPDAVDTWWQSGASIMMFIKTAGSKVMRLYSSRCA